MTRRKNIVDELEDKLYEAGARHNYGRADCEEMGLGTFEVCLELREAVYRGLREVLEREYLSVAAFKNWEVAGELLLGEILQEGGDRSGKYEHRLPGAIKRYAQEQCRLKANEAMAAMFGEDVATECDEVFGGREYPWAGASA